MYPRADTWDYDVGEDGYLEGTSLSNTYSEPFLHVSLHTIQVSINTSTMYHCRFYSPTN
ncbi:hypothetical protein BDV30DRAFT_204986 [Aspergillus minisclerotigenes]|uniref:Uncharacterized protein n=1 Tax=Aspergillus minisclerotigenes TaxID=656917 RepID=A0A5N6JEK8_9EURO|nr:hypothetical protein BDV30DRAFT_204986 [Aspergillus minisclerotigenes]